MLDEAFASFGAGTGLPAKLRAAVTATPRHRFVHRFRVDDGPLCDQDAEPDRHLPVIYSDTVMRHVDAAGRSLPSSNSQPSYILFLLHLLSLEPGQTVLEIGSGSGWLAAIMARLVGPAGRVVGIELIGDLAAQSRKDLAAERIENVEIITGDGTHGHPKAAPYDRAIITAATWDLPAVLFDQVREGGLILVPIELRSPDGCAVTLLRRQGAAFVAERTVSGWFVPLQGSGQDRPELAVPDLDAEPVEGRAALPLGLLRQNGPAPSAAQFRAFLGRTEPGFVASMPSERDGMREVPPFGLRIGDSWALWQSGEMLSRGSEAASALAGAYARWAELGLPGLAAFRLEIHPADTAPAPSDRCWIERRGGTALAWHLRPEIGPLLPATKLP